MIQIQEISKTFNKGTVRALSKVSFSVKRNTMVGIIGPDGAGKTTLLRILAGILTVDSGSINFFGNSNMSSSELHRNLSYMPQKFGLYEELRVIENLNLYAKLQEVKERETIFKEVLSITRLENFRDRLAGNLSGGMKQKLGLACSLLKKPKILILDEPSVGVDPISRRELIEMVNSMLLGGETTVVWSTAYLDEAENLEHVVLLNEGRIIFEGPPKEALKKVESRVFLLKNGGSAKREISQKLMEKEFVEDSMIKGQDIRVVVSSLSKLPKELASKLVNTKPNFEDACVDMLGGVTIKKSAIDEYMEDTIFQGDDNVVEALNLSKKFGDFKAADKISFSVKRGRIFGLLGPNGSGKSTTFKILCGLLRQDEGTAKIVGIDIANMGSDAKMNIGYMAQKFSLYPTLSVRQNMEFFSGAYRLSGKRQRNAVDLMLQIFHLEEMEKISTGVLSLGHKQRLALACSIMHKPQVLFLDEPTSGVDPLTRKEFWIHINSMVRHGVSVVVTTHFMDEAENCDDIALVYKGQVRASGSPDKIKNQYRGGGEEEPTLETSFINVIKEVEAKINQIQ